MINRIMTTRQKKFLEKTFKCLGVDIDTFLLISELPQILAKNKELEEENQKLKGLIIQQNENLLKTNETLNLHIIEHNNSTIRAIWGGSENE